MNLVFDDIDYIYSLLDFLAVCLRTEAGDVTHFHYLKKNITGVEDLHMNTSFGRWLPNL